MSHTSTLPSLRQVIIFFVTFENAAQLHLGFSVAASSSPILFAAVPSAKPSDCSFPTSAYCIGFPYLLFPLSHTDAVRMFMIVKVDEPNQIPHVRYAANDASHMHRVQPRASCTKYYSSLRLQSRTRCVLFDLCYKCICPIAMLCIPRKTPVQLKPSLQELPDMTP